MLEQHRVAKLLGDFGRCISYLVCFLSCNSKDGQEVTSEHIARLWLNEATSQVLKNGLSIVGVKAPDQM